MLIIEQSTAGSPTDAEVKWTDLRPQKIAQMYKEAYGVSLSNQTVKRILAEAGYRRRRPSKALATGKSPYRAAQFRLIFYFAALFAEMEHNPIISVDTKKKERLGSLDRGGQVLCKEAPQVFDHDYPGLSEGKVIPHGIYDMKENKGYVTIGTSNETAEFIGDNLIWWWEQEGMHLYPEATHILLFCDGGGANGYRHYAFKKKLIQVAEYIGVRIVVVHYPPYCSKWNPIEHRLFSQMHHQAKGCLFTSYEQVKQIYEGTHTKTGLTVMVRISHKEYKLKLGIKKEQVNYFKTTLKKFRESSLNVCKSQN